MISSQEFLGKNNKSEIFYYKVSNLRDSTDTKAESKRVVLKLQGFNLIKQSKSIRNTFYVIANSDTPSL